MPLPSPIPHPATWFDAKAAVARVIGPEWPDGDERALRELAEAWVQAAKRIAPVLEDADQAARAAVAAMGGAEGRQGAALRQLWAKLDAMLDADVFEELGALVARAAEVVEAAKLEIYLEVTRLLTELETLAALSTTTPGVAAAGAEPAIIASRHAVARILDRAVGELAEQGAEVARVHGRLGRFSFGLPELADLSAAAASDLAPGTAAAPPVVQGGDLAMAYGVGSVGTAAGVMAMGPGAPPRATTLKGRYGERALRGNSGEILSEVTVGVITDEGVRWSGLGQRAGTVIGAPQALRASEQATAALSSLDIARLGGVAAPGVAAPGVAAAVGGKDGPATVEGAGAGGAGIAAGARLPGAGSAAAAAAANRMGAGSDAAAAGKRQGGGADSGGVRERRGSDGLAGEGSFTLSALASTGDEPERREADPEPFLLLLQAGLAEPATVAGADAIQEPDPKAYEELVKAALARPDPEPIAQRTLPAVHQEALLRSAPERHGDLTPDWLRLINAGGAAADPRRAGNTADVIASVLDTWLLGRPRVASLGTHQMKENLVELRPDAQGFARVEAALKVEGHGSCAVIVQEWAHGERHATTVHNRHGELYYVDAQRHTAPVSSGPMAGAIRMQAYALGPDASPIDLNGVG